MHTMVCLETTFLVDMLRNEASAVDKVEAFLRTGETITVAAPTVVELLSNAYRNRHVAERQAIERFCREVTILPLDGEAARQAARIDAQLIEEGNVIDFADVLIAGIALLHDETLVTRNDKHFRRIPNLNVMRY